MKKNSKFFSQIPMQPNEPPDLDAIFVHSVLISRPYIVNIKTLAKGDEYDRVTAYAEEAIDFFSKSDNRVAGVKKFRLVKLGYDMPSESLIEWGEQNGLTSPPMLYVNDFAKANPEVQRGRYVVALGELNKPFIVSSCDRRIFVLGDNGTERVLGTRNWDNYWNGNFWFLFCE